MKVNRKQDREPVLLNTHLAGATHHNNDGSSRQAVLEELASIKGDIPVHLVREPNNAFDENAIAVFHAGRQIGYLPGIRAPALAAELDRTDPQVKLTAAITRISARNRRGNRSVELRIAVEDL